MADNITTPVASGTQMATKDIDGKHHAKSILTDGAGTDAIGLVTASPAATTVLGRLKTIADGLVDVAAALAGALEISADALPLPTGAATSAKQDAAKASIDATALTDVPFAITPHASNPLTRNIKAIAIVTGGTVVFRAPGGSADVTVTLPTGLFPLPASHIRATSTASGLTGF